MLSLLDGKKTFGSRSSSSGSPKYQGNLFLAYNGHGGRLFAAEDPRAIRSNARMNPFAIDYGGVLFEQLVFVSYGS